MKRLGIYFYFDKNGWVGRYAPFYLSKLKEFCEELCVVVNAPLTPEGRDLLSPVCDTLLVRDNVGFDSWAYKYAIEHYGYEKLKEYDEVILNNFTCYGPIYPLNEMFEEMESRNCDFWGINRHPDMGHGITSDPETYICEHIQSYFIAFKKNVVCDNSFREYWEKLPPVTNYVQAIARHELRCSAFFEKRGFRSSTYMDFEKYGSFRDNASLLMADVQHIEQRNPLVKRKLFYLENDQWINHGLGHIARDVLEHIDKKTDYDVDLIWEDLLKTQKMSVLRNNLHLNYFLPENHVIEKQDGKGAALILFVYYDDLVDYCVKYAESMPEGAAIYIISAKEELLGIYKKRLEGYRKYRIEYRRMENRGRDVSAYLVAAADVFFAHKYVCCMHDKKTEQLKNEVTSAEFSYHCFENNLATPEFVQNVIHAFKSNPRLGMLVPPTLCFSQFFAVLGYEMGPNTMEVKKLFNQLKLDIPFDECPVAPLGTMFWVRGEAFAPMFNYKWRFNDFPEEPLKTFDGTVLHAIERVYQSAVQQAGYFTGWLATSGYAATFTDNIAYMLRELNCIFQRHYGAQTFLTQRSNIASVLRHISSLTNSPTSGYVPQDDNQNPMFKHFWILNHFVKCLKKDLRRYRVLSKITFGSRRKHYAEKKDIVKALIHQLTARMVAKH